MIDANEGASKARVTNLRQVLAKLSPEHDTPIGLVHPYWARKPMNVVKAIVEALTDEGDLVVDPFMGSGTTIFAAAALDRRAVGSDISPMAHYIVDGTLDLIENSEILLPEIRRILGCHRVLTLPWFSMGEGIYVERERYVVDGEFRDGNFRLDLTEVVTKQQTTAGWSRRTSVRDPEGLRDYASRESDVIMVSSPPLSFGSIELEANSRIAIPRGANLAQYFTVRNQTSINVLLDLILASPLFPRHAAALKFVLSASLPLLRLSDKKASSQWPYWRPKVDLTSRNPVMVFASKMKQIERMVLWAADAMPDLHVQDRLVKLLTVPAQQLRREHLPEQPALVLTDPPYGDQVPYGEYAAMWNGVLALKVAESAPAHELVRSDGAHRQDDSAGYLDRLRESFIANAELVRHGGFLAWFYQDQDLRCWSAVYDAAQTAGFGTVDVIPIPKQRRSMKTVTSPNATLDGDLLCLFAPLSEVNDMVDLIEHEGEYASLSSTESSYFGRYAAMIGSALKSGDIHRLAAQYVTVKRALDGGEG